MASVGSYASLAPPLADDTMEMSSPANRPDDDIDIDFGDYAGEGHMYDDHMLEDGQTRPGTATDDMMEDDDVPVEHNVVQEEVMQDGDVHDALPVDHDEDELIDYGDEDYPDESHTDTIITGAFGSVNEPVDEEHEKIPESTVVEVAQDAANTLPVSSPTDILPPSSVTAEEIIYDEAGNDTAVVTETAGVDAAEQVPTEGLGDEQPNTAVDATDDAEEDTPGTPTDTGLHPMTIRYGDLNVPLFKSRRQPDGLLKDDNIASLSLAELMKNCRQRLAIKIGEDLSEDQELHLGFDRLGLLLVEDSRMAFESSLNDILEVYLHLQRNDGLDEIPPLSLTLSLQLKFASSLSILKQAAASGQGMSTFGFLNVAEQDEYYQEQYEHGGNAEFAEDEYAEEEFQEQNRTDLADGEYDGEDDANGDFQEDDPTDGVQDEFEDAYYHNDPAYHAGDQTETGRDQPPPGIETILEGEQQPAHALYNAPKVPAETGIEDRGAGSAAQASQAHGLPSQAASTTSSATVEHDVEIDHSGEYDLIYWNDDDDDLTSDSSVPTATDQEDFSHFLTELGEEDAGEEATAKNVEQVLSGGDAAVQDASIPADEHTLGANEQQHTAHPEADQEYDEGGQYQDFEGDGQEPGENEEEPDYDQADTFDEQQEEHHLHDELGVDHEQFHAAEDFSNGDFYEHGPEHDAYDEGEEGLDDTVETVVHHPVDDEHEVTEDFEAELDFDEATEPADHGDPNHGGSLSGKRSFDDFDEHGDSQFGDEDRDVKKVRGV